MPLSPPVGRQHLHTRRVTCQGFFREDGRIRLQPENETLEPIYANHVQVLGKVIGVFRQVR